LTSLAVLIPVKSSGAKSRLSKVLSEPERREFATLLLTGVLGALGRANLIDSSYVISSDRRALGLATRMGAGAISEDKDAGVNSAVTRGIAETGAPGTVLVIPADLPLLRAAEVRRLIALESAGLDVVIAPSSTFDGTNALLFPTVPGLDLSYDNDSFWNHIVAGARKGLSVGVSCTRGLMFDIDSPEDLKTLAQLRINTPAVAFARRMTR
jgi:2-phospho-L-lactate guanylyltransferase